MRRLLRDLSAVLLISGGLVLADAAATLAWQEPLTSLVGLIRQGEIDHRFQSAAGVVLTGTEHEAYLVMPSLRQRLSFLARLEDRELRTGDAIGRIVIHRMGIAFDVVEGTDHLSLEKGPGHYPGTALPGMGETVAIAGHRTTYLAPFHDLGAIRPGDPIELDMPYGRFLYVAQYTRIVLPTDTAVIDNVGYDRLVLSACNPLYSAAQRIVVFARLASERATNVHAQRGSGPTSV